MGGPYLPDVFAEQASSSGSSMGVANSMVESLRTVKHQQLPKVGSMTEVGMEPAPEPNVEESLADEPLCLAKATVLPAGSAAIGERSTSLAEVASGDVHDLTRGLPILQEMFQRMFRSSPLWGAVEKSPEDEQIFQT